MKKKAFRGWALMLVSCLSFICLSYSLIALKLSDLATAGGMVLLAGFVVGIPGGVKLATGQGIWPFFK